MRKKVNLLPKLLEYLDEVVLASFVFNPGDSILQVVRVNSYRVMTYDDIENILEGFLEGMSQKEFEFYKEQRIIEEIYDRYQKYDNYDYEQLYSLCREVYTQFKEMYKKRKKKKVK